MSEILDNQIVTGELLNNIAIDLGLPEFNRFGETKFGVDKLNNITGDLTGKGILDVYEKCFPAISGNTISIAPGVIIFDSGAKLRLTEPVVLEIENTDMLYIYAVNDTVNNKISLNALSEPLTSGDYFLLCEIKEGIVYDKRVFSKSKVAALGGNVVQEEILPAFSLNKNNEMLIYSIQLLNPSATKVIGYVHIEENNIYVKYGHHFFVYDSIENKYVSFGTGSTNYIKQYIAIDSTGKGYPLGFEEDVYVRFEFNGGLLNVYAKSALNYGGTTRAYKILIV